MTQPTATIIAACIAVAAALITLLGVYLNIRHQTTLDERKATRERELDELRAAREDAEIRRQERTTLFAEVLRDAAAAHKAFYDVYWEATTSPDETANEQLHEPPDTTAAVEAFHVLSTTAFRLELLGYPDEARAVSDFQRIVNDSYADTAFRINTSAETIREISTRAKEVALSRAEMIGALKRSVSIQAATTR